MRELNADIKNRTIDFNKLLGYGFIKEENYYLLKCRICNGQFEMIIKVLDNKIYSKLIDLENNEEYILIDILGTTGEFVGMVREEYEHKLQDIIDKCTSLDIFKSYQAKEIIKYIKEKYNDDLEFLWKKFDDNAIWRNKQNNKWYAALLIIKENKLGIESDKIIEIIDLKYQKGQVKEIADNKKIFPGYHMNKDSWITIKLDNSVDTETILELIDNSYKLSLN